MSHFDDTIDQSLTSQLAISTWLKRDHVTIRAKPGRAQITMTTDQVGVVQRNTRWGYYCRGLRTTRRHSTHISPLASAQILLRA
jgi:hypothetical protein